MKDFQKIKLGALWGTVGPTVCFSIISSRSSDHRVESAPPVLYGGGGLLLCENDVLPSCQSADEWKPAASVRFKWTSPIKTINFCIITCKTQLRSDRSNKLHTRSPQWVFFGSTKPKTLLRTSRLPRLYPLFVLAEWRHSGELTAKRSEMLATKAAKS